MGCGSSIPVETQHFATEKNDNPLSGGNSNMHASNQNNDKVKPPPAARTQQHSSITFESPIVGTSKEDDSPAKKEEDVSLSSIRARDLHEKEAVALTKMSYPDFPVGQKAEYGSTTENSKNEEEEKTTTLTEETTSEKYDIPNKPTVQVSGTINAVPEQSLSPMDPSKDNSDNGNRRDEKKSAQEVVETTRVFVGEEDPNSTRKAQTGPETELSNDVGNTDDNNTDETESTKNMDKDDETATKEEQSKIANDSAVATKDLATQELLQEDRDRIGDDSPTTTSPSVEIDREKYEDKCLEDDAGENGGTTQTSAVEDQRKEQIVSTRTDSTESDVVDIDSNEKGAPREVVDWENSEEIAESTDVDVGIEPKTDTSGTDPKVSGNTDEEQGRPDIEKHKSDIYTAANTEPTTAKIKNVATVEVDGVSPDKNADTVVGDKTEEAEANSSVNPATLGVAPELKADEQQGSSIIGDDVGRADGGETPDNITDAATDIKVATAKEAATTSATSKPAPSNEMESKGDESQKKLPSVSTEMAERVDEFPTGKKETPGLLPSQQGTSSRTAAKKAMKVDKRSSRRVEKSVNMNVIKYPNGDVYKGDTDDDNKPHGNGKMTYTDGSDYQGAWIHGVRHGFGKCLFPDGSFYKGDFESNTFHGQGVMFWSDGAYYQGEWSQNLQHGQGKEVYPGGKELRHKGLFQNGYPVREEEPDADEQPIVADTEPVEAEEQQSP